MSLLHLLCKIADRLLADTQHSLYAQQHHVAVCSESNSIYVSQHFYAPVKGVTFPTRESSESNSIFMCPNTLCSGKGHNLSNQGIFWIQQHFYVSQHFYALVKGVTFLTREFIYKHMLNGVSFQTCSELLPCVVWKSFKSLDVFICLAWASQASPFWRLACLLFTINLLT